MVSKEFDKKILRLMDLEAGAFAVCFVWAVSIKEILSAGISLIMCVFFFWLSTQEGKKQ